MIKRMFIIDIIWLEQIVDKLASKHHVTVSEVEEVLLNAKRFRFISKGRKIRNENVYAAYGQTNTGHFLSLFFIYKPGNKALVISARDMDSKERKRYGKNR